MSEQEMNGMRAGPDQDCTYGNELEKGGAGRTAGSDAQEAMRRSHQKLECMRPQALLSSRKQN
jgi:hypothetical protein